MGFSSRRRLPRLKLLSLNSRKPIAESSLEKPAPTEKLPVGFSLTMMSRSRVVGLSLRLVTMVTLSK